MMNGITHIESSLTSPEDRDIINKWKPDQITPILNKDETEFAMSELNINSFISKFPRVDRTYADSAVPMQNIGLFSFIPAKGATPNDNGVYGFAKLRGNYSMPVEAEQRAEYIIRNLDSCNPIYHAYVGRPFPVTTSSKYSSETSEVDIRVETAKSISGNIKRQKDDEQKTIREMKNREEELLVESEQARKDDGTGVPPEVDPYDEYITQCVKKAQLSWTFLEHLKKLKEIRSIILKTRTIVTDMDGTYPEFKDKYFEKYMDARKISGLENEKPQDNFIKFMVEDIMIPTIDTDEILPELVD